jgi:hypothetical protein
MKQFALFIVLALAALGSARFDDPAPTCPPDCEQAK